MPKLLIGLSSECDEALRHACGEKPLGPYVEGLLSKLAPVKKAAAELGFTIPKRLQDGRGKYERKPRVTTEPRAGYH